MATLAIFPWGDVIEEFLDPLGLDAEDYAARMRGGWLFGYVAALQRQGHRVVVVHGTERRKRPQRLVHAETGAAIWLVPGRRSGEGRTLGHPSARSLVQWARTPLHGFARVLRETGCDSILVQDYEHARFDALVGLARALNRPVSATFQGGDVTHSPLEARVRPASLRACQAVIVPSARERDRLASRHGLSADRIHDIPNPLDADTWRPEARQEARAALGLDPDAFLVVNHGRIDIHRKGLDVLLAAWRQVAAARPDARLAILGSGQDHAAFARLAEGVPGLTWQATYLTDPPAIRRWLSAADAYVTLSRIEGMPVAPLEAMACGLPVVASDAHGLADIFQSGEATGGLLVPRDAAGPAAEALLALAADPARRARLGRDARRTVTGRYGLEPVGRALAACLAPATRGKRPASQTAGAPAVSA
jgi:glycosyltransferase involved in cell wall biosynthesis